MIIINRTKIPRSTRGFFIVLLEDFREINDTFGEVSSVLVKANSSHSFNRTQDLPN
jgi:hypothetical protein